MPSTQMGPQYGGYGKEHVHSVKNRKELETEDVREVISEEAGAVQEGSIQV